MRIAIRVDSSLHLGVGHVMRCLALAAELRDRGAEIFFICEDLPGRIFPLIAAEGFSVTSAQLSKLVDCLIVDHYRLDAMWENAQRRYAKQITVIDDLADRPHDCDLLVDVSYHQRNDRYDRLVPENCQCLLGPKYAMVRAEFGRFRRFVRRDRKEIRKLLVFWGGTDSSNQTEKSMHAIARLKDLEATIVVGRTNPNIDRLQKMKYPRQALFVQVDNFARLMVEADLFLGAAGGNIFERMCLGLSSISIAVAYNQVASAELLANEKLHFYLGMADKLQEADLEEALWDRMNNPAETFAVGLRAMNLVDGLGIDRIADFICRRQSD